MIFALIRFLFRKRTGFLQYCSEEKNSQHSSTAILYISLTFGRVILLTLSLIFGFQIQNAFSQRITLKQENTSLKAIFKSIEGQSQYVFFSKEEEIEGIFLNVNYQNVPLKNVLSEILKPRGFTFQIFGKTIAVKKLTLSKSSTEHYNNIPNQNLIRGQVLDENELPLKDIQVEVQATGTKTTSDESGHFKLSVIDSSGILIMTGIGFLKQFVNYADTSLLKIKMKKGKDQAIELAEVKIQSKNDAKTNPNKFVDLTNRSYMNLSQVLQGTIPGLSLQVSTSTSKQVTGVVVVTHTSNGFENITMSVDEFLQSQGKEAGQSIIDNLLNGKSPSMYGNRYGINTINRTTTTLVPQVRGSNSFAGSTAGMLVVIDGFPQDGFPAGYPMTNVESIEVIKDPKELIKWGNRANNGLILIKTKSARKGQIQVNYSANFYFEPASKFNRKKLRLASTGGYLNYVKDIDSVFRPSYTDLTYFNSPAQRLFAKKRLGLISDNTYQHDLDSLSLLDNEQQLNKLQQDRFTQNHTLTVSGGSSIYKFNLLTNYINDESHDLGGYNKTLTLNLNNTFNLLSNKLRINWLINYTNGITRTGYSFSPSALTEPYQLLFGQDGRYVYDYSSNFSPYADSIIRSKGYLNHGVNLLEDARSNKNLSRLDQKRTSLNFNWDLLPGLSWGTSLYYDGQSQTTNTVYGKNSSYTRQLVNSYGEYTGNGVNFYVPWGDVLQLGKRTNEIWNLRSGFGYAKTYRKHHLDIALGGGASSTSSLRPNNTTLYGYNAELGTGAPIFLPTPDPNGSISNYNSVLSNTSASNMYPSNLTRALNGDSTRSRNLNGNAALIYRYSNRLTLSGNYNTVLSPLYGQASAYSKLSTTGLSAEGLIFRLLTKWIQNVTLKTGIDRFKLPDLPASYSNVRYQQTIWNNYAIWVNGLQPTQQQGQSSQNWYQKLGFHLLDSMLTVNVAYNTLSTRGDLNNSTVSTLSNTGSAQRTLHYMSADINGQLRHGLLRFQGSFAKSPEGQNTINGGGDYDIGHEKYFHSNTINLLNVGFKMETISPYQGLGLVMGTNVASNGSFTQAINNSYSLLPPNNKNFELYTRMGINDDAYSLDLRYYHRQTAGLNNYTATLTDPTTGTNAKVTYSTITNKGIEAFFKVRLIRTTSLTYEVTLNGAYNVNIVTNVPDPIFYGSVDYTTMYRNGYDASSIWSVRSASLNHAGDPQYYDKNGNITAKLDSSSIAGSVVYSGKTRAPWTGGFIHDVRYRSFFARTSITFNLGHVMRTYIPYPAGNAYETSELISERWRKPGDELYTNVPRIDSENPGSTSYRAFVVQNGTNSIVSADNIRLQEVMIGCNLLPAFIKKIGMTACTLALSAQNLYSWNRNPYHIDPATVDAAGRVGLAIPKQFSLTINVSF